MPYRLDLADGGDDACDRLIDLGAFDVEVSDDGRIAALMPDSVPPQQVAAALAVVSVSVSPARGRDAGSVWILRPRPMQVGPIQIIPASTSEPALSTAATSLAAGARDEVTASRTLRLIDAAAFGTGRHPTTALVLEAIDQIVRFSSPAAVLDVGTGSGVLALAALLLGVPEAHAIDIDPVALDVTAENARLNHLGGRVRLAHGGPEIVTGRWPLVVANVLAAPLMEMAPALVQRVGHHGFLVLSGIPVSVEPDLDRTYRRLGMRRVRALTRGGWVALVFQATW